MEILVIILAATVVGLLIMLRNAHTKSLEIVKQGSTLLESGQALQDAIGSKEMIDSRLAKAFLDVAGLVVQKQLKIFKGNI